MVKPSSCGWFGPPIHYKRHAVNITKKCGQVDRCHAQTNPDLNNVPFRVQGCVAVEFHHHVLDESGELPWGVAIFCALV